MLHAYDGVLNRRPIVIDGRPELTLWDGVSNEIDREEALVLCHDVDVVVMPHTGLVH